MSGRSSLSEWDQYFSEIFLDLIGWTVAIALKKMIKMCIHEENANHSIEESFLLRLSIRAIVNGPGRLLSAMLLLLDHAEKQQRQKPECHRELSGRGVE